MTWNLDTIAAFFAAQQCNPYEYNRLAIHDPCGRMLAALRAAEQSFTDAKTETRALGTGDFSIAPERTVELGCIMTSSLATRTAMIAGLESAGRALGDAVEPTVKSLLYRIDYCQRTRKTAEVVGLTAKIVTLQAIADSCFT
jgi:hypothetical protein